MKKALFQLFLFTIILLFNFPAIANILVEYAGIVEQENNFELPKLQIQSITNCDTSWFHYPLEYGSCNEIVMFTDAQGDTIFRSGNRNYANTYSSHSLNFRYYSCSGEELCVSHMYNYGEYYSDCHITPKANFTVLHDCSHECGTFIGSTTYQYLINNNCVESIDEYVGQFGGIFYKANSYCDYAYGGFGGGTSWYNCTGQSICGNSEWYPGNCNDNVYEFTLVQNIYTANPNIECKGFYRINLNVLLEGYWNGTEMSTDLVDKGLLPSNQPFNTPPWNYAGTESINLNDFNNAVDWVLIELIDPNYNSFSVDTLAAIVLSDGSIVNHEGGNCLTFFSMFLEFNFLFNSGTYVRVHHPGHLSINSSNLLSDTEFYDFTLAENQAMGIQQLKQVNGAWVMYAGDFDNNNLINNQDFNLWSQNSASINQYLSIDADGNGIINNLDYNVWELNRSKIGNPNLTNDMSE